MKSPEKTNEEEELVLQNWYRKRKWTAIVGIILKGLFSFEYSSISISALYYFKYTFNTPDSKHFFSLAMGMMYLAASTAAFFTGRHMDRTRNLRQIVIVLLILAILGNIMYCLPFSKWLPIIARGMCGMADGIQPAISGEFSRCYTKEELGKILSIYHILAALMFAIAPSSPVLFQFVNFKIGSVTFNQYNFIGLFQAGVTLLVLIMSYVGITDLTKDPGYELFIKTLDKTKVKNIDEEKSVTYWTFKDISKDTILVMIIIGAALLQFLACQLEIVMNMAALSNFGWSVNKLGILAFVASCTVSAFILVLNSKLLKSGDIYYYLFTLTLLSAMATSSLLLFSINAEMIVSDAVNIAAYFMFIACLFFYGFGSVVYAKWIMFSLVPSHSRCYVDSVRFIAVKGFSCIGFFTAADAYNANQITLPIFGMISFAYSILTLMQRNVFFSRL